MRRSIFGLLVLIFSCCTSIVSFAEPRGYLKRPDFESLGLFVQVGTCPFTEDELRGELKGEWLRARLKGYDNFLTRSDYLHLSVSVSCLSLESVGGNKTGVAMSYEIFFGTKIKDSWLLHDRDYGNLASSSLEGKNFLLTSIREGVSRALTEYLESNI